MKLAIFATHPIQYQVPWFRALASREEVDLTVYYALVPTPEQQGKGFGIDFSWDVPLLDGYRWEALPNAAARPSLDGFFSSRTPEVKPVVREAGPDVAIVTGWHALPLVQALRACQRSGVPCVVRGESNALRPRPRWKRAIHRALLSRFAAALAIGKANREFYERSGMEPDQIFTAPYFVDNDRFRDQRQSWAPEREAIRREWGIPPSSTCFAFVGKLIEKKRVGDFLVALEIASRVDDSIRGLVVGEGERRDGLETSARERGLPVTFTGFLNQTEVSRAYVAADCLVLPSDFGETWGLVVNEAMVSGLPAIVSDRVGCGPDLVEEGVTGWTFPFADVEALAARLVEVSGDPERRDRMGESAARRVARYSIEAAVAGTMEALRAVVPPARARRS